MNNPYKYWKVIVNEPFLRKSLDLIGAPEDRFTFFTEEFIEENNLGKYVLIEKIEKTYKDRWEWDNMKDEDQVKNHYEYMGCPEECTPRDIEIMKIEKEVRNYNL